LPSLVIGPVLWQALRRLASIRLGVVMVCVCRDDSPRVLKSAVHCSIECGCRLREGRVRLRPEGGSREHGIDVELLPPNPLITPLVQFTMMSTAEGHGKFVAHLAPKGASLRKLEMVRI